MWTKRRKWRKHLMICGGTVALVAIMFTLGDAVVLRCHGPIHSIRSSAQGHFDGHSYCNVWRCHAYGHIIFSLCSNNTPLLPTLKGSVRPAQSSDAVEIVMLWRPAVTDSPECRQIAGRCAAHCVRYSSLFPQTAMVRA